MSRLQPPRLDGSDAISLRWSGRDTAPPGVVASGVAKYELWRQVDDGPARRVATTTATQIRVGATPGERYSFYTIAVDAAGNRERPPK